MNRAIPTPIAAQIAQLNGDWAEWAATRSARANVMAARRTRVLEPHIGLWLTELAAASEPLGMCDMRARHGTAGVTKSQLTRSIAVVLERGHAKVARRGPKNAAYYVITSSGRTAAADLDPKVVKGVLQ
ncbi:MAG: hypothetical protein AzoDbin1_04106 [Azoarcus sp.]|nr:hypothetical protein [Azoarcus sp.]